jgi:hypothetical protein
MSIDLLIELLGLPSTTIDTGSLDQWSSIERPINLTIPDDFKQYINTFGTGKLADFIYPLNPFSTNKNLNLMHKGSKLLAALREIREIDREECPYPIHPEEDGLFPWSVTDNGDVIYWYTIGKTQDWKIVVNESRGPEFEEFALSTTMFLRSILLGDIHSRIIISDCIDKSNLFMPLP